VTIDWKSSQHCSNGHAIRHMQGIPICIPRHEFAHKITSDPGYPLQHAIDVAQSLADRATTFRQAVNRFFEIREAELSVKLDREKELITRRAVPAVNQCIAETSYFLSAVGKPFPASDRVHIDIGCGLGYGLAASARSYFGPNVIGIDLSPPYLTMTRLLLAEHGISNVRLVCADICEGWPIPLDQYDVGFISMEGVLEHIKNVSAFFINIQKIKSFPFALYLTVPYRWSINRESHFNMRFVSWLPKAYQDRYIAWRLGVPSIDHVEFYTRASLRRTLERYFAPETIMIELNDSNPLKSHYLRCVIYAGSPQSIVAKNDSPAPGI
jgi:SAM-dependent methyltransferase